MIVSAELDAVALAVDPMRAESSPANPGASVAPGEPLFWGPVCFSMYNVVLCLPDVAVACLHRCIDGKDTVAGQLYANRWNVYHLTARSTRLSCGEVRVIGC